MTPLARRRALAAAAAAAALSGCGPKTVAPEVPAPIATEESAVVEDAAPVVEDAAPEAPDVPTCLDVVADAVEAGTVQDAVPCCRVLDTHFSERMRTEMAPVLSDWPTRDACCEAIDWQGGLACTPWGPPPPPGDGGPDRVVHLDLRTPARAVAVHVDPPPPALAAPARHTWHARMLNEHGSAPVFEALADQLAAAGAPSELVQEVAAFAAEERRHGVLCGAVVEALGGEAVGSHVHTPMPTHPEVGPLEAALRNLISVTCLSETVAVALIGAEHHDMPEGPLKDLLSEIWADEVGHARAGWRWLSSLLHDDAALAERLGHWLRDAFAHLEAHEIALLPADAHFGPEGSRWGLCDGGEARALFYDVVETVIVPGLEARGLPATEAWTRHLAA